MDYLDFLPKKTVENIQNNYVITSKIEIGNTYGVYRNREFLENVLIKNIKEDDAHLYYPVKNNSQGYYINEVVPIDKLVFFNKVNQFLPKKIEEKSKQRLKDFFKKNYSQKYNN